MKFGLKMILRRKRVNLFSLNLQFELLDDEVRQLFRIVFARPHEAGYQECNALAPSYICVRNR